MAKAENKTKPTQASVTGWLAKIPDEGRRKDCATVVRLMKKATKSAPRMWGLSIVGFGDYQYRSKGGREVDWFLLGFASRKADLTLYVMDGPEHYPKLLAKLGKHRLGVCCLYLKRLSDVDLDVLDEILTRSVRNMRSRTGCT